jgi:cytoskeletal protein CcmA (bactofilin family)
VLYSFKRKDGDPAGFNGSETSTTAKQVMTRLRQLPKDQAARSNGAVGEQVSSIGPDMTILGDVLCEEGTVHVFGRVHGELRVSDLVIDEGGQVTGDIYALTLTVHGSVTGTIHANSVKLLKNAVVKGDMYHQSLSVDEHALFEGLSRRMQTPMGTVQMQIPNLQPLNQPESAHSAAAGNAQPPGSESPLTIVPDERSALQA